MAFRARRARRPAERLRSAVDALPQRTKVAMLRGIDGNRIIVGAYTDPDSGGICPMLAAHRNGGRTNVASFAKAWDAYTGANRPRLARERELRTLRSLLEASLTHDPGLDERPLAELAAELRSEREAIAARTGRPLAPVAPVANERAAGASQAPDPAAASAEARARGLEAFDVFRAEAPRHDAGGRTRLDELKSRLRWSWIRPTRSYSEYRDLLAAASEELAEQRAEELVEREKTAAHD